MINQNEKIYNFSLTQNTRANELGAKLEQLQQLNENIK